MKKLTLAFILSLCSAFSLKAARLATETYADDVSAYRANQVKNELIQSNNIVRAYAESLEAFYIGTNVIFGITNYISGTYPLDDGKFKISELRTNQYETIYNSHTEITNLIWNYHSNSVEPTINGLVDSFDLALSDKAPLAWGSVTSDGATNEMPNSVWMTQPTTVFAGGTEFRRLSVGDSVICILTTKGKQVQTVGNESGVFQFSDFGGTNGFGFATSAAYEIGADSDGINVNGEDISVSYNVQMSGYPCIYYTPSLETNPIVWTKLNKPNGDAESDAPYSITWTSSSPSNKTANLTIPSQSSGFFRATIEMPGSSTFFSTMPADFQAGILCTDGIHKVGIDYNNGSPRFIVLP